MRNLVVLILVLSPLINWGQLTVGQVYNFSIGDVHQTSMKFFGNNTPSFSYDSIMDKYYSSNNDSVFYIINKNYYSPPSYPGGASIQSTNIDTVFYTNLNSEANHYPGPVCISNGVSSLLDSCGQIYEMKSPSNWSCFEMEQWSSKLYQGIGGPYYSMYYPGEMQSGYFQLIYYRTALNGECGLRYSYLGMDDLTIFPYAVHPTIVESKLNISGIKSETQMNIINNIGEKLESLNLSTDTTIDIKHLDSGVYLIRFVDSNQTIRILKI